MPTKHYPLSSDIDATCNSGIGVDRDMTKTALGGATADTFNVAGVTSYTEQASYMIDVSGDSPITGSQTYNLSIDLTALAKADVRFRIRAVNDTGCVRTNSSGYQEYLVAAGTGIKTFSLTLDFTAADERLELAVEGREQSGAHGTRSITISVDDDDTWVEAPWPAAAAVTKGSLIYHG